jgi:pimeloyl-ACP methyl ester carboxylesterase
MILHGKVDIHLPQKRTKLLLVCVSSPMILESIRPELHPISSNGFNRNIAYLRHGELSAKHIFLCLPGLLETKESFYQIFNLASRFEDCCWLSIDYCGRGDSDLLTSGENYSFSTYLSDIEDFVERLIIPTRSTSGQKFHLIGTSMGGILAMHLISRQNQKIDSLILNDIGLFLHWSSLFSLYRHIKESNLQISHLRVDQRVVDAVSHRSHFDLPYDIDLLGMIFYPLLRDFNGRVVLLHSDESPICPLELAIQSKSKIPGLIVWTVKSQSHPVSWNENLTRKLTQLFKLSEVINKSIDIEEIMVSTNPESLRGLDQRLIEKFLTTSKIYFDSHNQKVARWVDVLLDRLRIWKRSNS